eukprot:364208-Chlamydomonas_euryale.AAC.41
MLHMHACGSERKGKGGNGREAKGCGNVHAIRLALSAATDTAAKRPAPRIPHPARSPSAAAGCSSPRRRP